MKNNYLKMKPRLILIFALVCMSCQDTPDIIHKGEMALCDIDVKIDTISVTLDDASGWGCLYMKDSTITFADEITCRFYDMDLCGRVIGNYFRKGRGKNEIVALIDVYPILNDPLNRGIIIDNNNIVTLFDTERKEILKRGRIDFGWEPGTHNNYSSPSLYNIAEFSDLGVSFYLESDSILVFQANIVNRMTDTPGNIDSRRYDEGAIFGRLNLSTMKVESVMGHFPEIYKEKPMPHLESFQYCISGDTVYVNHAVDSLIYVYQYPDGLMYTIGYECSGIDRGYTVTQKIDQGETFDNDVEHVGLNSGLMYCKENGILCRTYIKSLESAESGMQLYKDDNLIADLEMPPYFKLLGYYDGDWYGCSLVPHETQESTSLVLYRIKINCKQNANLFGHYAEA